MASFTPGSWGGLLHPSGSGINIWAENKELVATVVRNEDAVLIVHSKELVDTLSLAATELGTSPLAKRIVELIAKAKGLS